MKYILQRLGFYAVALWSAVTLNFFIPRAMPGDPATMLFVSLRGKMDRASFEHLKEIYGFSGSTWDQYWIYLKKLSVLDFGVSTMTFPQPTIVNLKYAAIWTIYLAGLALLISFAIGVSMGMYSAWRRGSFFDSFFTPFNVVLTACNPAVIAILLFFGFCMEWDLFPLGRAYNINMDPSFTWDFIQSVLYHSVLPIASIVIYTVGGWHLTMRNNMINLLNDDFMIMAKAKGLSNARIMYKYAARNAILPVITQLAMSVGFIFGGVIFTEIVFNYPGLGKFSYTAVTSRDYSFIQGQMLFLTVAMLAANLLTDILNVILDPRLR